jgi:hypothetical protein
MINSYLGNICPFPLVSKTCPQHQIRLIVEPSNMAAIGFTYAHQMLYSVLIIQSYFRSVDILHALYCRC